VRKKVRKFKKEKDLNKEEAFEILLFLEGEGTPTRGVFSQECGIV
jgi:hypothetical protein